VHGLSKGGIVKFNDEKNSASDGTADNNVLNINRRDQYRLSDVFIRNSTEFLKHFLYARWK
jgi:hypothetical protein